MKKINITAKTNIRYAILFSYIVEFELTKIHIFIVWRDLFHLYSLYMQYELVFRRFSDSLMYVLGDFPVTCLNTLLKLLGVLNPTL